MNLSISLKRIFIVFLILGFSAQGLAESAAPDNPYTYPALDRLNLKCQPQGTSKEAASSVDTAAGVCLDCEKLKNSSFSSLLAVKEFVNPLNSQVAAEDYKNVVRFVEEGVDETGEYTWDIEGIIENEKKRLGVFEMCAASKYNPEVQRKFSEILSEIDQGALNNEYFRTAFKNTNSIEKFKTYDSKTAPTGEQLRASCEVYYFWASRSQVNSVASSGKWFSGEKQNEEKQIVALTSKLNKLLKKKAPDMIKDLPKQAVDAGVKKCGMTRAEYGLIRKFSFPNSHLNAALRGREDVQIAPGQAASIVRIMNSGLAKIRAYEGVVYVQTEALNKEAMDQYKLGSTVQFSSYLNGSAHELSSGDEKVVRYVIKSKTGRYMHPIYGSNGNDQVLFMPMTRFKISGVKKVGNATIYEMDEQ